MIRPLQYGALFVAVLLPYDSVRAEKVHVLTNSNFDHLTAHGTWLVDVFAPWSAWGWSSYSRPRCCEQL